MSKMTAEMLIKDVSSRKVKEGTPDERMIYDVLDGSDVKWTVWERDLAEQAHRLKGQATVAEVTVEQNGKYTNRTLHSILEKESGFSTVSGSAMQTFVNTASTTSSNSFDPGPPTQASYGDRCIMRQVAGKVAVQMITPETSPNEFWANVEHLARYFETGETPYGNDSPGFTSEPVGNKADDDIPF